MCYSQYVQVQEIGLHICFTKITLLGKVCFLGFLVKNGIAFEKTL